MENELPINAGLSDLEKQVAEIKGHQAHSDQTIAQGNRLTIWQFSTFTAVMAGTLFGTLTWISGSLREEMRTNREMLEKRIELSEKNLNARFEDLRQVVLSQQKQQSKP